MISGGEMLEDGGGCRVLAREAHRVLSKGAERTPRCRSVAVVLPCVVFHHP